MCRSMRRIIFILVWTLAFVAQPAAASDLPEEKVDVAEVIFGHIGDSSGWHITEWNEGTSRNHSASVHSP